MRRKQKNMMKTSSRRRRKANTQIAKDQQELHPCNSDKIASFELGLSPKCRVRLTRGLFWESAPFAVPLEVLTGAKSKDPVEFSIGEE